MLLNSISSSKGPVPTKPIPNLPISIGYAIPIITLLIVLVGFVYYIHLIQKGKLALRETFVWILFTLFMVFIALYLLILQIMSTFNREGFNIFSEIASFFGLVDGNGRIPEWLVFIIMIFLAYLYAKAFQATIKMAKLKANIGTLAKEVAILNGKLNNSLGKTIKTDNKKLSPKKKVDKTDDK